MTDESVFGVANREFLKILWPYLRGLHGLEDLPDSQPAETDEGGIPLLAALRATQRARRRNRKWMLTFVAAGTVAVVLAVAGWRRRGH